MEEGAHVEFTVLCDRGETGAAGQPCPWYKTIAPTYAGVMLWFVFWQDLVERRRHARRGASAGLGPLIGLIMPPLICHFFFYMVPAMLGMQTGLPLYVVGTSTYGVQRRAKHARASSWACCNSAGWP